ncbi:hypothetical protein PsYK624_163790 [Phanerochaete sordida]|uniref:Uncharacterized protein n=1 Tax=Phanerochaete sordida TaxID=48140 RepID=A0A9P3GW38_9APHY|nr:hypothetical protein PsYK624_163790 [Phanerochaete sordida]
MSDPRTDLSRRRVMSCYSSRGRTDVLISTYSTTLEDLRLHTIQADCISTIPVMSINRTLSNLSKCTISCTTDVYLHDNGSIFYFAPRCYRCPRVHAILSIDQAGSLSQGPNDTRMHSALSGADCNRPPPPHCVALVAHANRYVPWNVNNSCLFIVPYVLMLYSYMYAMLFLVFVARRLHVFLYVHLRIHFPSSR